MKRVYIALIILAIIVSWTSYTAYFTNDTIKTANNSLTEISTLAKNKEYEKASENLDNLIAYFENREYFLCYFVPRSYIIEITVSLATMEKYTGEKNLSDFLAQANQSKERVKCLENLFFQIL